MNRPQQQSSTLPAGNYKPAVVLALIFFLLATGIVVAGYFYYRDQKLQFRYKTEHQLSAIAELKVGELVQWRKECLADGNILFKNALFSALVRRFLDNPGDAAAQHELRIWLGKYETHYKYSRVSLFDVQGAERLAVPAKPEPVCGYLAQNIAAIQRLGQVTFMDFHRDAPGHPIHLAVLVPILDEANNNRPLGVLVLRIDPAVYLYPFIQRWPVPSKTAETLLLRREGNEVVFLNELRFQKNAALTLRIPLADTTVPAVKAALGQEGIVEGVDYRSAPVLAALRAVPDSPWFMVARQDIAEVYAPLRSQLWQVVGMIAVLLFGAGAGVGLVWRQQRVRFYQEQWQAGQKARDTEELLRALVEAATDAIYIKDRQGRYLLFNTESARITGKSAAEVLGKDDTALFPADEARVMMAGDQGVIEKATVMTYEEYVTTGEGDRRMYLSTKGPIFDDQGNVRGLFGIARDITERKRMEEALRQSEERLALAQRSANASVWDWDIVTGQIEWSRELFDLYGLDPDHTAAGFEAWGQAVHPDDRQLASTRIEQAVKDGTPLDSEYRVVHPDGKVRWISALGDTVYGSDGRPQRMSGICLDITERKQAEETLRETNEYLENLINYANAPIIVWDAQLRITRFNHAFEFLTGRAAAEVMRQSLEILFPPEQVHSSMEHIKRALAGERWESVEIGILHLDGSVRTVLWNSATIFTPDGKEPMATIAQGQDITERKQAEQTLLQSRKAALNMMTDAVAARDRAEQLNKALRLKNMVFDASIAANSIADINGVLTEANDAFVKIWGYGAKAEVLGRPLSEFIQNQDEAMAIVTALNTTGAWEGEYSAKRKDGSTFIAYGLGTTVRDQQGKVIGYQSAVLDITERRQAEKERERLNLALETKNKELEQVVYVTSHDLRSPLVNVQGFSRELAVALKALTGLVQGEDVPADVRKRATFLLDKDIPESIRYIQTSTAKMDALLAGLLRISRLGREATQVEQLDIPKMMSMVIQSFEFRIKESGTSVTCMELPACRGDMLQINQVFSNLLDNALKYLDPARPGVVTVSGHREEERVIYCVEDNGIGIAPEQQKKIFQLFYKLDPNTPGEGLGMSIIGRILEKNKGRVWVESEVGKGSKFYVELPA